MSNLIPAFVFSVLSAGLVVTPSLLEFDSVAQHWNGNPQAPSISQEAVQFSPQSLQTANRPDTSDPKGPNRGDPRREASA